MVRLFSHYVPFGTLLQIVIDAGLLFGAILIAMAFHSADVASSLSSVLLPACLFAMVMTLMVSVLGLYRRDMAHPFHDVVARIVVAFLIGFPLSYCVFYLIPSGTPVRESLGITVVLSLTGMLAVRTVLMHRSSTSIMTRRVLVLGTGAEALEVERSLQTSEAAGLFLVGFYPVETGDPAVVSAGQVLPNSVSIVETVRRRRIEEVIVAVRERRGGVLPLRELLDCKLEGVQITDLSSFFERFRGQVRIESLRASWLIYGEGFRQGRMRNVVKRLFDIVASSILLVLTLPVMVIAALAIALESGFPIFYRQERMGQGGKVFEVIKFRSMRTDAEADGKPRWAKSNDSRITRIGQFIRRTRIDELPQIFNVLRGEMSFVGPRPERPFFVNLLSDQVPFYSTRHSVKPGITGWAQVKYKYGSTIDDAVEKLQYDLYYVKNHTLFLDLLILLQTVRVVVSGEGAH